MGCSLDGAAFDAWMLGEFVDEGRTGWELVVVSMDGDVLKVSVAGVKSGGLAALVWLG